jgi:hypothetical protein
MHPPGRVHAQCCQCLPRVSRWGLHLDNGGAQISEHRAAARCGGHRGQFDDICAGQHLSAPSAQLYQPVIRTTRCGRSAAMHTGPIVPE